MLLGIGMSGVTILPNQVLVSRWFHARIGLVNGIVLGATALGAAIAPALITRIIEASDWRSAFVIVAALASLPPMVVVLTLVRDRPEDMGLRPYGSGDAADDAAARAEGYTLRAALRTPTFWVFAAVIFLGGMPCYSHNKHILVFLKELGFRPIEAADYKSFSAARPGDGDRLGRGRRPSAQRRGGAGCLRTPGPLARERVVRSPAACRSGPSGADTLRREAHRPGVG